MFLRKIKDIRISNKTISVIRDADINIKDLETQISKIKYSPTKNAKNLETENALIPPFIQVFYYLFFKDLIIPTEKNFFDTYVEWMGGDKQGKIIIERKEYDSTGIKDRLNRTYPSLIRDLHFLYLLDHSKRFDQVDYSMERDYYNGLDLKITCKERDYFISIFIDTTRGKYFKHKKITRHNYKDVHELEFNVSFNSLTKHGSIYLLNKKHIDLVEDKIIDAI